MENFKIYHKIEKEITLPSKVENNHLYVFYQEKWCRLSLKTNPEKFFKQSSIQSRYNADLCKELGLPTNKGIKYSSEYYLKHKEVYCKASKKYYEKKKAEKVVS